MCRQLVDRKTWGEPCSLFFSDGLMDPWSLSPDRIRRAGSGKGAARPLSPGHRRRRSGGMRRARMSLPVVPGRHRHKCRRREIDCDTAQWSVVSLQYSEPCGEAPEKS